MTKSHKKPKEEGKEENDRKPAGALGAAAALAAASDNSGFENSL